MSGQRWEYASVSYSAEARRVSTTDPEYHRLSLEVRQEGTLHDWKFYWWLEQKVRIRLPDTSEDEVRTLWETGDKKRRLTVIAVLNELGGDGWELVSHAVSGSAMGESNGYQTAGFPIQERYLLKRPVHSD